MKPFFKSRMSKKVTRALGKAGKELQGQTYLLVAWNPESSKFNILSSGKLQMAQDDPIFHEVTNFSHHNLT